MRKVLLFFCLFMLGSCCVFADDELPDDGFTIPPDNSSTTPVVVDITQLLVPSSSDDDDEPQEVVVLEPQLVNVTSSIERVSASDSSGFKAVILGLIGDYETVVTDYEYRSGNNTYTSHSISIERDWAWICSCGVFAVWVLFFLFYWCLGWID